jgi:hypothetical protein
VLVLFLWNCPTRQTANRIVYVPAPPPAAGSTAAQDTDSLVIEEPQPPEPEETSPAEQPSVSTPSAKRRPRPATRTEPSTPSETAPEVDTPPPVEVPALEPRENPGRQAAQRQQITSLQDQVRNRISRLERANFSGEDRHTLEDARTFLGNSERALAGSDFERALNLVRKAAMLIAVLEQQ